MHIIYGFALIIAYPDPLPVQFFLRSSRIKVNLLSYESKPTDTREQYDGREDSFGWVVSRYCKNISSYSCCCMHPLE